MRRLLGLILLVLLVGGVWMYRDLLPFGPWGASSMEVSQAAADEAEDKLERLRSRGDQVRLSSVELSSLLLYRRPDWAPESIRSPVIRMSGDTLRVAATVPTAAIPSHPDLERVRGLLPDSARLEVGGRVRTLGNGSAALDVREVEVAGIPIPERYFPPMLERFGHRGSADLLPTELQLPLPPAVSEVRVEDGYLVLIP